MQCLFRKSMEMILRHCDPSHGGSDFLSVNRQGEGQLIATEACWVMPVLDRAGCDQVGADGVLLTNRPGACATLNEAISSQQCIYESC
jgi:hypothetical protein